MTSTRPSALAGAFQGDLIGPDHPEYDTFRRCFNRDHDQHPALVARCTGPEDVRAALHHARENVLGVSVRGGGHSAPGYSSCDGGLVIDTSPMKRVEIDTDARTGRFGAGLTWGELDAATQEFGLAVTGGRVSDTGVAGLTLGSGSGWLERMYGPTAASLLSAEVVTADGRILRADAEHEADLFWGLRGGGGNFGVVTEFEFRLHPVGPLLYAGLLLHPRSAAGALTRFYRDFMEQAPDEVTGALALISAPPAEFVPEQVRGEPACGVIVVYVGDVAEGEKALSPLVEWGDPWVRMVGPMPYTAVQTMLDAGTPVGVSEYFKVDYLPELPDEAIDTALAQAEGITAPLTQLIFCPMGGASRLDADHMALSIPPTKWVYFCLAIWWGSDGRERHIDWTRSFHAAMRPWATGTSVPNFIGGDEGTARLRNSYGPEKYARLVALKDRYDPDNVFALNQNVPPSG
ncbi:FAD-binding oxidoreductase [Streptomyces vietnamensis]|uniref:FAD-linked oxidase n=1 Tax=Streptomyces vietnamensis TaxID=362257 RepID=A0A0B5HQJ0_9ACTN|nr:FAD-binding oxidoreductase [Streptomyces vietnamensis]AJF64360.1 FAD-linked oxidase [Streptomyces vietnamensis]